MYKRRKVSLLEACKRQKITLSLVRDLLDQGYNENEHEYDRRSVLYYACANRSTNIEIVQELLDNGAIANVLDDFNRSPLFGACCNPEMSTEIVEVLLRRRAYANQRDVYGNYPLNQACSNNNWNVVESLLKYNFFLHERINARMIVRVMNKIDNVNNSSRCLKLFIKYMVLEENLKKKRFQFDTIFDQSSRFYSVLSEYKENCSNEVRLMRCEVSADGLSIHGVLKAMAIKLLICSANDDTLDFFFSSSASKKFPIYGDILSFIVDNATMMMQVDSINTSEMVNNSKVFSGNKIVLNIDTAHSLVKYLTKNDLTNLIKAYYS